MWKKMKRVIALLCVAAMVGTLTGLPVEKAEAAIDKTAFDYSFDIGQAEGNDAVSAKLDGKFDVYSYYYGSRKSLPTTVAEATSVAGPVEPSGTEVDSENGTQQNVTFQGWANPGKFLHLNTDAGYANGLATLTYTAQTYTNFYTEYEFFPSGQMLGLVFGSTGGTFPVTKDSNSANDTGVVVFMAETGKLEVAGAIDASSVSLPTGVTTGTDSRLTETDYICTTSIANRSLSVYTGSITTNDDTEIAKIAYTLCVSVQDGVLKVWEKQTPETVVSVKLTSNYQGGSVSLFSNVTNSGAFRSFGIKALASTEKTVFDYSFIVGQAEGNDAVSTRLDGKFDVYNYVFNENRESLPTTAAMAATAMGPVEPSGDDITEGSQNVTFQGWSNPGKFLHLNTGQGYANGLSALTYTAQTYTNFYTEYEFFPSGQMLGLVFGSTGGTFPVTKDSNSANDTGVVVFMAETGKLEVAGAIDASSVSLPTGVTTGTDSRLTGTDYICTTPIANRSLSVYTGSITTNDDTEIAKIAYTLCVSVQDGVLKAWEKQTPETVVSVKLTSNYQGGSVSLFSNVSNSGAFRSFGIKALTATEKYEFSQVLNASALSGLKDNFLTYQFDNSANTVTKSEDPDTYWNVAGSIPDGEGWQEGKFAKTGWLIPNHRGSANKLTTLTLRNKTVRNFEASYTYYINYTGYGIMVAEEGKQVDANYGLGLKVLITSDGAVSFSGAYDKNSVKNVGFTDCFPNFVDLSSTTEKTYTVNVSVKDGVVKVWLNEYPDCYVTANLTAGYQGGALSLYATGCDQGAFTNLTIKKYLEDSATENMNLTYRKEDTGDYTAVTLYATGAKNAMYSSILTYDTAKYTYVGTRLVDTVAPYSNPVGIDENGQIKLSMISNKDKKQAVVIFENNAAVEETTPFGIAGNIYSIGGIAMNVTSTSALYGDVSGDNTVDVSDLIRLKKYAGGESVAINQANSDLDETGVFTSDANLALMRKALVGIGNTQIGNLVGKTGLFLGDSIAYGAGDTVKGTAWAGRLQSAYGMENENIAVSGATLSSLGSNHNRKVIVTELDQATKESYDYVILHGGVNDVWATHSTSDGLSVEMGEITAEGTTEFDTTTLIGAIEHLFYTAKQEYPNAKVGYIINFDISEAIGDMETYVTAAKSVCDKWEIPYIDLYNNATLSALNFGSTYTTDRVHPSAAGYEILTPIIAAWMETL